MNRYLTEHELTGEFVSAIELIEVDEVYRCQINIS